MSDILNNMHTRWLFPLLLVVALLFVWLIYRRYFMARSGIDRVLNTVAFERMDGLVLPNGDEGVIQIDHLLLTSQGLLVLHVKEAPGKVFGGDKMQDWTVIAADRRYTFSNPQHALYDRIAAIRQIVRDVPVEGRILFLEGSEFAKGVPDLVCLPDELIGQFSDVDKAAGKRKVESFMPHWERLAKHSVAGHP
ncbi:MAG: nuclease-related domain-containing protein [Pseudomonadota bacterium]